MKEWGGNGEKINGSDHLVSKLPALEKKLCTTEGKKYWRGHRFWFQGSRVATFLFKQNYVQYVQLLCLFWKKWDGKIEWMERHKQLQWFSLEEQFIWRYISMVFLNAGNMCTWMLLVTHLCSKELRSMYMNESILSLYHSKVADAEWEKKLLWHSGPQTCESSRLPRMIFPTQSAADYLKGECGSVHKTMQHLSHLHPRDGKPKLTFFREP